MLTAKISSKGQVTIPESILEILESHTGDCIPFEQLIMYFLVVKNLSACKKIFLILCLRFVGYNELVIE